MPLAAQAALTGQTREEQLAAERKASIDAFEARIKAGTVACSTVAIPQVPFPDPIIVEARAAAAR